MKKTITVKILSLIFCLIILLSYTACGKNELNNGRIIKLSEISKSENYTSEPDEEIITADNFEIISKLDSFPEHMENNKALYAKLLENMLKLYYSGIVNGRINSDNFKQRYSNDKLPSPDESYSERKNAADFCTIGGALEYYCYDNKNYMKYLDMYNGCLPYFCCSRDGNIFVASETSAEKLISVTSFDQALINIFRYAKIDDIERDSMIYVAKETDRAVKIYYEGIKSGKITKENFTQVYTKDELPDADSSNDINKELSDKATIGGALEYSGFYKQFSECIKKLGYNKKSDIFTLPDYKNPDIISIESLQTKISSL